MTGEGLAVGRVSDPLLSVARLTGAGQRPALPGSALQHSVASAALGVLVVANAVGLWLAALLLWPGLGSLTGPLTYGHWVPVHLDLQLYGWCSLPLIGLLLARFRPTGALARLALAAWCGTLLAGALAWLGGDTSGKIFLDWSGPARVAFAIAQVFLWAALAQGWWCHLTDATVPWRRAIDAALLLVLLGVPVALYFSAQPSVYPPVNPHSGGATGHSLLASSLGIVGLALALPALLGRTAHVGVPMRGASIGILLGYAANWIWYAAMDHGNASHHSPAQIAGLATLLVWPVWLGWWFRRFTWEVTHRRWLLAAAAWAGLLVLDGYTLFLPGVLERMKFTNALVAHSHLAMAGLLTSLNVLMLISLAPRSRLATALASRGSWLAWNLASFGMIAVLTALGWQEGANPRLIADGAMVIMTGYVARLLAGAVMFGVSVQWSCAALRQGDEA